MINFIGSVPCNETNKSNEFGKRAVVRKCDNGIVAALLCMYNGLGSASVLFLGVLIAPTACDSCLIGGLCDLARHGK